MDKNTVCTTCKSIIKKGMITHEGEHFCSEVCSTKAGKKPKEKKKNVCEFC